MKLEGGRDASERLNLTSVRGSRGGNGRASAGMVLVEFALRAKFLAVSDIRKEGYELKLALVDALSLALRLKTRHTCNNVSTFLFLTQLPPPFFNSRQEPLLDLISRIPILALDALSFRLVHSLRLSRSDISSIPSSATRALHTMNLDLKPTCTGIPPRQLLTARHAQ